MADGNYRVRFKGSSAEQFLTKYYNDAWSLDSADDVAVRGGAITPGIDVVLAAPGFVKGIVTDGSGNPLPHISVTAYAWNGSRWEGGAGASTLTDGSYEIAGLVTGNYRVEFRDPAEQFMSEYYSDAPTLDSADDVAVGATTAGIDAVLLPVITTTECPVGRDSLSIQGVTYPAGTLRTCQANIWLSAGPEVTVSNWADVAFVAPTIVLKPGFRVEAGGVFRAGSAVTSNDFMPALSAEAEGAEPQSVAVKSTEAGIARPVDSADLPEALRQRLIAAEARVSDLYTDAGGNRIVFTTDAALEWLDENSISDVYLYGVSSDQLRLVSTERGGVAGNGPSHSPRLDDRGIIVVYVSEASDLIDADNNSVADIFLYDVEADLTERVSVTEVGAESNQASDHPGLDGNGEEVVYDRADASDLGQIYRYDRFSGETEPLGLAQSEAGIAVDNRRPVLSPEGRYLAYLESEAAGEEGGEAASRRIHIFDRITGEFVRLAWPADVPDPETADRVPIFSEDGSYLLWWARGVAESVDDPGGMSLKPVRIDNPLGTSEGP